ncbi:MAG: DUF6265 family protein [Gemmatimonadales bacterium]
MNLRALCSSALCLTGPLAAQAPAPRLAALHWLHGCWIAATPQRIVEETWTVPRGGVMIGVSRAVQGDSLTGYELVILRVRDSVLVYEAHPSDQPVAEFTARSASESGVVFENPMHDFPQRVGYRPVGGDSLVAYVEGSMHGRARRVEFRYARARCPGL